MRRSGLIFALLMILGVMIPTQAQDQRVLDRIDQAMAHLTQWLGRETAITRQNQFWSWEEVIYGDASFGCGYEGASYPTSPDRAFRITISVDGIDYDYRLSGDGSLLVLCGADGAPLYRTDAIDDVPEEPTQSATSWVTMLYSDGTDLIRLVNDAGLQAIIQRPSLPNEALPRDVQMAVSRNGRYLVQNIRLADDSYSLDIYDIRTGNRYTIPANANEQISLGAGSNLIFNDTSTEVAVSFAQFNDATSIWELAVIELSTGTIVAQIDADSLSSILVGGNAQITDAINGTNGTFFPQVAYFDNDDGIHARMILWFSEGLYVYPAFVWYPAANSANVSPYGRIGIDILPDNGTTVYAYNDPDQPLLEREGMFPAQNVLAVGIPTGTGLQEEVVLATAEHDLLDVEWARDGDLALLTLGDINYDRSFGLADTTVANSEIVLLPSNYVDVSGVGAGFLALTDVTAAGSDLIFHVDSSPDKLVYTAPPRNGNTSILWSLPAGSAFGIDQIAVTDLINLPEDSVYLSSGVVTTGTPAGGEGVVYCEGTIPSQLSTGIVARVTFTDGSPLNVRTNPTTTAAIVDVIPEGTEFNIINGPTCADGYTWWQMELPGSILAWAVEGDADTYFIEPLP